MIRYNLLIGCIALALCSSTLATPADLEAKIAGLVKENGLSDAFDVFVVDKDKRYTIQGVERWVGAGFQPSVITDDQGNIHVFFQARLDSSNDRAEKMIAHVTSHNGGKTFSGIQFINAVPMQTYAVSAFLRNSPSSSKRISVLTSLSIDETIERLKDPALIKERLDIDVTTFTRNGATVVLEFYSDDLGRTWKRKEHRDISDRIYHRNGRD